MALQNFFQMVANLFGPGWVQDLRYRSCVMVRHVTLRLVRLNILAQQTVSLHWPVGKVTLPISSCK